MPYKNIEDRRALDKRRYKNSARKRCIRNHSLKRWYGITLEEYNRMYNEQKGLCFICGRSEKKTIKGKLIVLGVDHNHKTKQVRRLLCAYCNSKVAVYERYHEITDSQLLEKIKTYVNFFEKMY